MGRRNRLHSADGNAHAPECTEMHRFGESSQLRCLIETDASEKSPNKPNLRATQAAPNAAVLLAKPIAVRVSQCLTLVSLCRASRTASGIPWLRIRSSQTSSSSWRTRITTHRQHVDFTALAAHFNQISGVNYGNGDFNYDGKVNALDFNAIATNFGTTLPLWHRLQYPCPSLQWQWRREVKSLFGDAPIKEGASTFSAGWRFDGSVVAKEA
jgi:hypothetical protein